MRVKIERMGINGEGIAFVNRQPIFIEGALPQEVVDIEITENNSRYRRGKIINIVQKSKDRVRCSCRYHRQCGACSLMHVTYQKQLQYKNEVLKESLKKYADIDASCVEAMVANDHSIGYRNSFKLPVKMIHGKGGKLSTGLYMQKTNYFVPVDHCLIHEEGLENIRKQLLQVLNRYHLNEYDYRKKRGIRTLIVRGFEGKYQCCIVSGEEELPKSCIEECLAIKGVVSLWQNINTVKRTVDLFGKKMIFLGGERQLSFHLNNLTLTLSPKSFFQLNTSQALKLYNIVATMVKDKNDFVVEAYSGIGAISLFIKDKAKEIVGIESVSDAVVNANANAKRNDAKNVSFVCGDAAEKLTKYSKKKTIDTLIVDPPRSGLDDAMIATIIKSKIRNIIYISCNPATLGKNLAVLQNYYQVERIVPVDMFSQTTHVECVVLLTKVHK